MEEQPKKLLQWHAAFYAGIQIELEDEAENLVFENEHMLGTKPMQVDVLITKKDAEKSIQKNIGKIFRKYNLIEYKSPEDYLSINDFYKVLGYALFYMADTTHINEIKPEEISITFACSKYPRKLIKYLISQGYNVAKFSEVKNMCEALKELYAEELKEGILNTLLQLVRDDLLNLSVAAERAQMSVEEFRQKL